MDFKEFKVFCLELLEVSGTPVSVPFYLVEITR